MSDAAVLRSILLVLAAAAAGLLFWSLRRALELFYVRVEHGRVRHVRGRVPPALLEDLRDVIQHAKIRDAELRVLRESGQPRLLLRGDVHPDHAQQLRNVIGRFRIAQIRAGRPPRS